MGYLTQVFLVKELSLHESTLCISLYESTLVYMSLHIYIRCTNSQKRRDTLINELDHYLSSSSTAMLSVNLEVLLSPHHNLLH